MIHWKKVAIFAGGTLFGSAGFKLLRSKDAKSCIRIQLLQHCV